MSEQRVGLAARDDAGLEALLRASAPAIDWPSASPLGAPDVATRVRARLVAAPPAPSRPWTAWRPMRRGLVLALAALLALAAIAGAVGLGLPGLRLILSEPGVSAPPSPSPSRTTPPGPLGGRMGLGDPVALEEIERLTGVAPNLPADSALGPPDAVYIRPELGDQVAYVWAASDTLPETSERGVGLILMQFDGLADEGYREKLIGSGVEIETVSVDGERGFWISGAHFFFYVHNDGTRIHEERRWVGDALIWAKGSTTYRIESGLGRDATMEIARSLE